MKRTSFLWQGAGFAFSTLLGTLLHFLYDWTGGSLLSAPFSGVNESTWEHMKLLFWPMFLFALIQRPFFRDRKDYWPVKGLGILLGLALIPVLFYTGRGVFGTYPDWVNIGIFYVSAALAYFLEWRLFRKDPLTRKGPWLAFAGICLLGVLFAAFTFAQPQLPLFQDPLTGTYGMG